MNTPLTWDPGQTASASGGGGGFWDLNNSTDWYNGSADTVWIDTNGSISPTESATFTGMSGGLIQAAKSLGSHGLTFSASGYTVGGSLSPLKTLSLGAGGISDNASTLFSPTVINAAIILTGSTFPISTSGELQINNISGSTGITITAATGAEVLLFGHSTYTGTTTVSGGSLELDNSAGSTINSSTSFQMSNSAVVKIDYSNAIGGSPGITLSNSGKLNLDGNSQQTSHLGPLSLSAGTSYLDFGTPGGLTNKVLFADSSATLNTGTLDILNYNDVAGAFGKTNPNGTQLLVTTSDLTSTQLKQVIFVNPSGLAPGNYIGAFSALQGEIVPVPEISGNQIMIAGMAAIALLALSKRRLIIGDSH